MNLTELIHKLKKEGDKLYSWYLVETNVESVSDLEKTGEGFFLNFKIKQIMTYEQFIDLVSEMRQAQKEYFKTRDRAVLNKSKQLEAQVDAEINRVKSKEKQLNLF